MFVYRGPLLLSFNVKASFGILTKQIQLLFIIDSLITDISKRLHSFFDKGSGSMVICLKCTFQVMGVATQTT